MRYGFVLSDYWTALVSDDPVAIRAFFHPNALVYWHNTNECFTVDEFISVNVAYPHTWSVDIEYQLNVGEWTEDLIISAPRVYSEEGGRSFHCCSAFKLHDGKIISLDEYWGDDGRPPEWRRRMHIGQPIK